LVGGGRLVGVQNVRGCHWPPVFDGGRLAMDRRWCCGYGSPRAGAVRSGASRRSGWTHRRTPLPGLGTRHHRSRQRIADHRRFDAGFSRRLAIGCHRLRGFCGRRLARGLSLAT